MGDIFCALFFVSLLGTIGTLQNNLMTPPTPNDATTQSPIQSSSAPVITTISTPVTSTPVGTPVPITVAPVPQPDTPSPVAAPISSMEECIENTGVVVTFPNSFDGNANIEVSIVCSTVPTLDLVGNCPPDPEQILTCGSYAGVPIVGTSIRGCCLHPSDVETWAESIYVLVWNYDPTTTIEYNVQFLRMGFLNLASSECVEMGDETAYSCTIEPPDSSSSSSALIHYTFYIDPNPGSVFTTQPPALGPPPADDGSVTPPVGVSVSPPGVVIDPSYNYP